MIRCDKLGDFSDLIDDAWEDVKYSNNTEEILKLFTGVIRLQAGIQGPDLSSDYPLYGSSRKAKNKSIKSYYTECKFSLYNDTAV